MARVASNETLRLSAAPPVSASWLSGACVPTPRARSQPGGIPWASSAVKTASGLVYRELKAGTGAAPKPEDVVKVNYEGKFPSGKVFDSSIERKEPATFPLNGVIPCWTEGVGMMKVGGKATVIAIPARPS